MEKYSHGGNIYNQPIIQDFSVNLSPLGMPSAVVDAIKLCAHEAGAYPDPDCSALCSAIASYHEVNENAILCGNGAADLIIRIALSLKPKTVLCLAPSFSEYEKAAQLSGANFKTHLLSSENDFLLSPSVLDSVTPDVGLVYICNPNNPTGSLVEPELLAALLKNCEQTGAILAVDECFLPLTDGPSMIAHLSSQSLVIISAFTKTYAMAGLRLGYMISSNESLYRKVSDFSQSWSVSSVAQCAGLAALKCKDYIPQAKAIIKAQRPYLREGLESLGIKVFPSDANFLLCRSRKPLYKPLQQRGILIRSAANFRNLDHCYFRVCVSKKELNDLLLYNISEVLNG